MRAESYFSKILNACLYSRSHSFERKNAESSHPPISLDDFGGFFLLNKFLAKTQGFSIKNFEVSKKVRNFVSETIIKGYETNFNYY